MRHTSGEDVEHPTLVAIRELAKSDSIIALAKLRIELEMRLRRLRSIRDLTAHEILPRDLAPAIRDVLGLCNRAIHGEAIRDEDAEAVIDAGADLLQEFERLVREYGAAHPIEKITITGGEVEAYRAAQYRVVTIIPFISAPSA